MLVNSPGPDTRGGAAGYACVAWLTGVLLSASEADGGALNMLVNSPGMDEFEGVADGEIAEPIANVPPELPVRAVTQERTRLELPVC